MRRLGEANLSTHALAVYFKPVEVDLAVARLVLDLSSATIAGEGGPGVHQGGFVPIGLLRCLRPPLWYCCVSTCLSDPIFDIMEWMALQKFQTSHQ